MNERYGEPMPSEVGMEEISVSVPGNREYRPNKQEILKEYEITIRFLSVGCVVRVGCKEIPFRSIKEAMHEVTKYVDNPHEEGKRWRQLFESEE